MWRHCVNVLGAVGLLVSVALWGTMFCYIVPKCVDNRFSQIVSFAFGVLGLLPSLVVAISAVSGGFARKESKSVDIERCPLCGQSLPPGPGGYSGATSEAASVHSNGAASLPKFNIVKEE